MVGIVSTSFKTAICMSMVCFSKKPSVNAEVYSGTQVANSEMYQGQTVVPSSAGDIYQVPKEESLITNI